MVRTLVDSAGPKMEKALAHLQEELKGLRTGRASTALVEGVMVEFYGMTQPLKAMATLTTPDAQTIAVTPWDKNALGPIEKAIRQMPALGLNPMNDGSVIRMAVPPLTEERRREMVKSLGAKAEECRISLRNIRHEILGEVKKLEKEKQVTQDEVKFAEAELNKKIDQFQKRIVEMEESKSREIMSV